MWPNVGWKSVDALEPVRQDVRFGYGKPEEEAQCNQVRVFLRCVGRLRMERRQVFMQPNATISEARQQFQHEMAQTYVRDERGFEIPPASYDLPLSHFSSKCKLNLDFTYENATLKELAKETAADVAEAFNDGLKQGQEKA